MHWYSGRYILEIGRSKLLSRHHCAWRSTHGVLKATRTDTLKIACYPPNVCTNMQRQEVYAAALFSCQPVIQISCMSTSSRSCHKEQLDPSVS
eukprot:1102560-Amphidinium_carterae.1